MNHDLSTLLAEYHRALPDRIRTYLNGRGISDEIIALHHLGWNGQRITIPIANRGGVPIWFKLAKDPDDQSSSPKMLTSRGGSLELYGWERLLAKPCRLIICEGELDRLVLETQGIAAVTSTGGAGAFRSDWASDFAAIPEVYLCFDRDDAGRNGALRVGQVVPHAKMIELPEEVGSGGDVTDFFVRLGKSRDDFLKLLETAPPVPAAPAALPVHSDRPLVHPGPFYARVTALKGSLPITDLVSQYVPLKPSGESLRGQCPFHKDHAPSLMVYPLSGTFRCYGCGRHGDIITFLMAMEQLPFLRALDRLERLCSDEHGESPNR